LRGTSKYALHFGGSNIFLRGFLDSVIRGDHDGGRSTIGYIFTIGGTIMSWILKLQQVVALSTTKLEYVVVTNVSKGLIWLKRLIKELGKEKEDATL